MNGMNMKKKNAAANKLEIKREKDAAKLTPTHFSSFSNSLMYALIPSNSKYGFELHHNVVAQLSLAFFSCL